MANEDAPYIHPYVTPGAQHYTENPVPTLANGPMEHHTRPPNEAQPQFMVPQYPQYMPMCAAPGYAAPPFQMQQGVMGQPIAMPPMAYPGQPQQYYMQPQPQPQLQPGPPPHVTGQPHQFYPGHPGMPPQVAGGPPGGGAPMPFPGPPGPPGGMPFQQVGGGQVTVGQNGMPDITNLPPDIMGIPRTRNEFAAEQAVAAMNNEANEPQEFQPADPNPGRMYWVRQLDNEWIQMSRATIDRLACRWYIWPSGVFYAIRLED